MQISGDPAPAEGAVKPARESSSWRVAIEQEIQPFPTHLIHSNRVHSSFLNFFFFSSGAHVSSFTTTRFPAFPLTKKPEGQGTDLGSPSGSLADEDLLAGFLNGDQEALGLLFQRYERVIRSVATRILRNTAEAQDLVQDLFIFIQRKCAIFDCSKSSARSWIIQMAYHRAIERRRYLTSRQFYARMEIGSSTVLHMVGTPTAESDYSAEAVFGRNGLSKVLKSLTDDQRETLCLHFFDGYTLAEISQKSGQTLGNVRNHYYRGIDKLRKQMFGNNVPVEQRHEK
jgi:RNA polymerase sigma-70 factor (ECF subfamily)